MMNDMLEKKKKKLPPEAEDDGPPTGPDGKPLKPRPFAKGGVAKTVTKEMEYDYKSGKKSFGGSTAQRDAHAEKEGKIVAKHLAYDKAKDGMCGGGKVKKMAGGGSASARADGCAIRGKTRGRMV